MDDAIASEIDKLKFELTVARNEIQNLRKQITNLGHVHRKSVLQINDTLERFGQSTASATTKPSAGTTNGKSDPDDADEVDACLSSSKIKLNNDPAVDEGGVAVFKPIGIIRTGFPEKRAVPRQPSVGARLEGFIQLNKSTFTNPGHAVEGLEEFSHIWIIYHFHRNESNPKSKVAPPRLNGGRVGVFSTRSPHRPCPIGLSLVEIQSIEDSCIYFLGTDMVDGTPVLDIKPYIPRYDNPLDMELFSRSTHTLIPQCSSREEPDGEESTAEANANNQIPNSSQPVKIKVPNWVTAPAPLEVLFNERAEQEIAQLAVDKQCIIDVMSSDPRSVYLRTRYGSQIFTFQLNQVVVTGKFDDANANVTIVRVRPADTVAINSSPSSSSGGSSHNQTTTGPDDEDNARKM